MHTQLPSPRPDLLLLFFSLIRLRPRPPPPLPLFVLLIVPQNAESAKRKSAHVVGGLQLETNMLGAGRLLFSCTLRGARENIASSLRSRCGSIRTLSYLNHLQTQFACYTYPLWRSTLLSSQAGRHLSLVTTNYKPENADKSSHIAEELELEEEFAEDAGSPMQLLRQLRQGGYVRMDDIKHLKKVKQLRFTRHIQNLVKEGKMKKAREVFEQMKQAQVQLDDLIFNVLIAGYRRQGNVWACFKLFNEVSLIMH